MGRVLVLSALHRVLAAIVVISIAGCTSEGPRATSDDARQVASSLVADLAISLPEGGRPALIEQKVKTDPPYFVAAGLRRDSSTASATAEVTDVLGREGWELLWSKRSESLLEQEVRAVSQGIVADIWIGNDQANTAHGGGSSAYPPIADAVWVTVRVAAIGERPGFANVED